MSTPKTPYAPYVKRSTIRVIRSTQKKMKAIARSEGMYVERIWDRAALDFIAKMEATVSR